MSKLDIKRHRALTSSCEKVPTAKSDEVNAGSEGEETITELTLDLPPWNQNPPQPPKKEPRWEGRP